MITPTAHAACALATGAIAAAPPAHVPFLGWARIYLFCVAAFSLFVCFVMGMAFAAGPPKPGSNPWRTVGIIAGILLAIHAGYLLAPFWVGTRRAAWAIWMMAPIGVLVVVAQLSLLRWIPLGPRGNAQPGAWIRPVVTSLVVGALYLGPPLVVWFFRPPR